MTFADLSSYFDKLEATSSRLALIDILSDLFKQVKIGEEIEKICYLVQGRVAPFFEPIEFGMADKTVAGALAVAFDSTKEKVWEEYQKKGDMGTVALQLGKEARSKKQEARVDDVVAVLMTIAKTSGDGTVEKRTTLLADLLKKLDSVSVKFIVRIVLGNLRLGIGDPTILDALAVAIGGDKAHRKVLEGAYNRTSALGLVGKVFKEGGLKEVEKLKVRVGFPIRSELCERLPNAEKVIEKMGKVDSQFKYDGFRCVTGFTPVYVKETGIVAIRDIKVGDKVLTKTGSFKAVLAKNKRIIKKGERLFKFKTYLGEEIKISEGHPVLCFVEGKEAWKNIEEVERGDEVIFPIPQFLSNNSHPTPKKLELQTISGYKKTFDLNDKFYRFLGFWIGDGFTNDFHNTERVGLTFNAEKEGKLADYYEDIIKKNFQVSQVTRNNHNGGLYLYWRDEPLKHWLSTYFRREWTGKMLPVWFSDISKEHFMEFLQGWIESDGYKDEFGGISITTKERDLAAFAQLIALSKGIVMGLHYVRVKGKTYYKLIIPKTSLKARVENDRLIVKVLHNEIIKYRDPRIQLYDIQVQDDESFCVPMVTLHNCQIHKNGDEIHMFSRNLEDMSNMFPELIEGARTQIKVKTAILDTEALAYQPESEEFLPFQETTKRRRKHNIDEVAKQLPLKAFVFDILYADGKSLIDEPQSERMKVLEKVVEKGDILIPSIGKVMTDPKELQLMLDDAISKGLEGVVIKKVDSPYVAGGRNFNWVKLKRHSSGELHDTIDCVILGYVFGKGKRTAFGAGALLVGVYDQEKDEFVSVTRIGTGLSDDEWRSIKERAKGLESDHKPARVNSLITPSVWVKPEIVIEVLADEITRSPMHTAGMQIKNQESRIKNQGGMDLDENVGYALRFPRLVNFRDKDKKPEDATTVKELIEMFKEQGKK